MAKKSIFSGTNAILISLLFGIIVGQFLHDPSWSHTEDLSLHTHSTTLKIFEFIGFTIFMGLLKMLIVPLILVSVIVAVTSVGDSRNLGKLGVWALVYYFSTMAIAVCTGLAMVLLFQPGADLGLNLEEAATFNDENIQSNAAGGVLGVATKLISLMIPSNIFKAMAEGDTLSVIVFSIFIATVIVMVGKNGRPLTEFFEAMYLVVMRMVELVLYLAPLGVFCLLAWSIARIGLGVFGESIGRYMLCVIAGLAVHGLITLPLILRLLTSVNPYSFGLKMRPALFTAFGTDSSAATLPVTIETATEKAGVDKKVAGLVLPLGATVNMDGTALYEAVAVVFMAQAYGIPLGPVQYLLIAVTATLAAMGAAAVPSAGLVTMVIVVEAVNQSLTGIDAASASIPIAAIGIIIGVDRLLDMLRTTVNVWGDAVGAKLLSEHLAEKKGLEHY